MIFEDDDVEIKIGAGDILSLEKEGEEAFIVAKVIQLKEDVPIKK